MKILSTAVSEKEPDFEKFPYELYIDCGLKEKTNPDTEPFYKYLTKEYYFGFASKKDLDTWFSPVDIGFLSAKGFDIYVYEIEKTVAHSVKLKIESALPANILFGTRQVVFLKDKATKVGLYKRV